MGTQEAPVTVTVWSKEGAPDLNEPHVSLLPMRLRRDQGDQCDKRMNNMFLLEWGREQCRVHSERLNNPLRFTGEPTVRRSRQWDK